MMSILGVFWLYFSCTLILVCFRSLLTRCGTTEGEKLGDSTSNPIIAHWPLTMEGGFDLTAVNREGMVHQTASILILLAVLQCQQSNHKREYPRATSMVECASCLKLCTKEAFISKIRSFKNPPLKQGHTTIILLMLLLCGDIELNPGPVNASIYPCGCCHRNVSWSQRVVTTVLYGTIRHVFP